jgi:hypothetical protein
MGTMVQDVIAPIHCRSVHCSAHFHSSYPSTREKRSAMVFMNKQRQCLVDLASQRTGDHVPRLQPAQKFTH